MRKFRGWAGYLRWGIETSTESQVRHRADDPGFGVPRMREARVLLSELELAEHVRVRVSQMKISHAVKWRRLHRLVRKNWLPMA